MENDSKKLDIYALWKEYKAGKSTELRNKLAEYYLPLVKIVGGRLAISLPPHLDRDDLLSSGFFGLLDAIDRFDISRNIKFETYAGVRIRGAMIDYLRSKDWIPVTMRQKIRKYEQTVYKLETELGRSATDKEVAEALDISLDELQILVSQCNAATVIPLEEYLKTDAPEAVDANPADTAEYFEIKDTLTRAIDKLPEKERIVVSLYYYEELTLKEISLILHLSEARISQLHTKAIFKMRNYLTRIKETFY
ncbi:MAG: FliA/WhiG family RNA polymerase sigma factor [Selenomonadaceae bacterium]|nr:FliA/WhiG family RNA polymerase sigma factor [Selenomonadaceae bacterium]